MPAMQLAAVKSKAERHTSEGKRSHSSFTAHTFDSNLSVTSHNSRELPRHFDGSQSTAAFIPAFAFRSLPPLKIRTAKNLNGSGSHGLSKSFDGVTSVVRGDTDSWMTRREPTARLEQELDVFLSGFCSTYIYMHIYVRVCMHAA